jgi:hypothetical protein
MIAVCLFEYIRIVSSYHDSLADKGLVGMET